MNILVVENIDIYLQFVNQFNTIAIDYLTAIKNKESVVVDFQCNHRIDATCAKFLFGKLLIEEKISYVLCKNVNTQPIVVNAIFKGITEAFNDKYPNGIIIDGVTVMQPQVEMFDSSGDGIYKYIKLSDYFYDSIK